MYRIMYFVLIDIKHDRSILFLIFVPSWFENSVGKDTFGLILSPRELAISRHGSFCLESNILKITRF